MSHRSRMIALATCALAWSLSHIGPAMSGLPVANPGFGANSASATSWVAGAHAGYTWQQGGAVFGFETDLQGMNLKSSMNGGLKYNAIFPPPAPTDVARTSSSIDWYGTLRGQIGFANGPWMVYATGGLAYGQVSLNSLFSTSGLTLNSGTSETRVGWVGGVGVNYLLQPNLILNFQYQYVDLGSLNLAASSPSPALVVISQRANANAQFQAVMAGISWRFAPSGAMPWQGGYAGIHGGGAWGNDTNATYDSAAIFFSDVRLKRDVTLVGRRNDGLGVYAYKYLWSDDVYVGVMAQEVALIHPAAVMRDPLTGYMAVNYGMLSGN
jgi:outer membrane immunogenic protein